MLRVSSLGLTCRRHALCSYHLAAMRRSRVVAVVGKASIPKVYPHVLEVAVHPGDVYVEAPVLENEVKGRVEEQAVVEPAEGLVAAQRLRLHQSAGDDIRITDDIIPVPLTKPVSPLRSSVSCKTTLFPSSVKAVHALPLPNASPPKVKNQQQPIRQTFEGSLNENPITAKIHHKRRKSSANVVLEARTTPHRSRPPKDGEHIKAAALRPYRWRLLHTLVVTNSLADAWYAYETLLSLPSKSPLPIPFEHLHRLTRLIASTKPRTLPLFIRLLSVMSLIHKNGGRVQLWQWNALIDFAGKGWRKTRQQNFRNALDVYNDMITHKPPGATFMRSDYNRAQSSMGNPTPDIVTWTTLLSIAARTRHKRTIEFAASLQPQGVPPSRMNLLTFLRHYGRIGDMDGVRQVVAQITLHQYDVGLDGINAYIWAYGRNGRLEVASSIYTILKSRLSGQVQNHCESAVTFLKGTEAITVPENIVPDKITYTALLQAYAYHGHLNHCLQVFKDFIVNVKIGGSDEQQIALTMQMMPIYRAIFLGFSRHGHSHSPSPLQRLHLHGAQSVEPSGWNIEALEALFRDFLAIPADVKATPRTIYAILVAYFRTSDGDVEKLREVFLKLEERFPGHWGGRLERLRQRLFTS